MKYLIILTLLLGTCCPKQVIQKTPTEVFIRDTVYIPQKITVNSDSLRAEINLYKDSVDFLNNTIKLEDYLNANKIAKIKHYISITESNPKNRTFFYGWIKRTIQD